MNLNDPSSIETLKPKSYELHSPIRLLFQEKSLTLKKKRKIMQHKMMKQFITWLLSSLKMQVIHL